MKKIPLIFCVFLMACSHNSTQEAKAHIVERKMMADGKLMINYIFNAGNKSIADSEEVSNSIVPHDSITVVFYAQNPQKNHLQY